MTASSRLQGKKASYLLEVKINGKVLAFDSEMHRSPVPKGIYECIKVPHPNPKNIDEHCLLFRLDGVKNYIRLDGYLDEMDVDVFELIRIDDLE